MRACPACSGFVPDHLAACPHCDAAPSRWQRWRRLLAGMIGSGGVLVTMAACYGGPSPWDTCYDNDGDGWLPGCYNETLVCDEDDQNCDCNDHDPSIHPGALDPADGVDRDCDGKDGQRPGGPAPDASEYPDSDLLPEPDGGIAYDATPGV
jgi:hypothetical protein